MSDEYIHYLLKYRNLDQLVKLFQENNNCQSWVQINLQHYTCTQDDLIKFDTNNFGKVLQIVSLTLKNDSILYLLQVNLYRSSFEIKKQVSQKYVTDCLGQMELFKTSETMWICWNQIKEKIILLDSLDQYFDLGCPKNQYFTRASYDYLKKSFSPPFEEWKSQYCICGRPDIPDCAYIQCEKCLIWYHFECSQLSDEELSHTDTLEFICFDCIQY